MRRELVDFAIELYKHGCILFGEFTLTSGLKSPYYIDLRIVPSYPDLFKKTISLYSEMLRDIQYDIIIGIAVSGLPIASALSYANSKPLVYVRKEAKEHGTQRILEGVVRKGDRAVVVDDVATTGGSIIRAIEVAREHSVEVRAAVVLIDREQGARSRLYQHGVELKSIYRVSELLKILYDVGLIEEDRFKQFLDYIGGFNE